MREPGSGSVPKTRGIFSSEQGRGGWLSRHCIFFSPRILSLSPGLFTPCPPPNACLTDRSVHHRRAANTIPSRSHCAFRHGQRAATRAKWVTELRLILDLEMVQKKLQGFCLPRLFLGDQRQPALWGNGIPLAPKACSSAKQGDLG